MDIIKFFFFFFLLTQIYQELISVLFFRYFSGNLYLDESKQFFGPFERRLGIMGMLRFSLYKKFYEAKQKGVEGNMEGDGTLLGGEKKYS